MKEHVSYRSLCGCVGLSELTAFVRSLVIRPIAQPRQSTMYPHQLNPMMAAQSVLGKRTAGADGTATKRQNSTPTQPSAVLFARNLPHGCTEQELAQMYDALLVEHVLSS